MKRALIFSMLIGLTVSGARAAKHPVPLVEKIEGAKCLECHADETKGKSVHPALASGCLSCHEVRVARDITRVKLTAATPHTLCVSCHADKKASDLKGKVHSPAVHQCTECHDPHKSANKDLLLKPTAGATKQENLCLSCHHEGVNVPKGGSRHPALDMGCETCHVTHKTGDPTKREFAYHLTKDAPALCIDCHDPKDEAIVKAHRNQPFANADCLTCHDPHRSAAPMLMQAFVHPPFADKSCDTCHARAKDGKVVLTQENVKSLCVMCHEDEEKKIQTAKVQHPGAQGDCTDCHNPHAGRTPGFLQPDAVAACLACHTQQAEEGKEAHAHAPAFEWGCAICHEPHGGANTHLLRANNTNALCLECHGPDTRPEKLSGTQMVSLFNGKVKVREAYFRNIPILPLQYGLGHPTRAHPVSDVINPKTKTPVAMNCLSCHQPHGGTRPGRLVKNQNDDMNFCKSCHINGLNLMDVRVGGN